MSPFLFLLPQFFHATTTTLLLLLLLLLCGDAGLKSLSHRFPRRFIFSPQQLRVVLLLLLLLRIVLRVLFLLSSFSSRLWLLLINRLLLLLRSLLLCQKLQRSFEAFLTELCQVCHGLLANHTAHIIHRQLIVILIVIIIIIIIIIITLVAAVGMNVSVFLLISIAKESLWRNVLLLDKLRCKSEHFLKMLLTEANDRFRSN